MLNLLPSYMNFSLYIQLAQVGKDVHLRLLNTSILQAELDGAEREISSTSYDVSSMGNDDIYQFV